MFVQTTATQINVTFDLIDNAPDRATGSLSSRELLLHKSTLAPSPYLGLFNYESAWEDFKSSVMYDARFFDVEQSRQGLIEPSLIPLLNKLESPLEHGEPRELTPLFRLTPSLCG
jgi:hypothetical protein